MDDVLRLIYDYSKKGRLLDFNALCLIIENYKKILMLEDYILNFKILDFPNHIEKKGCFTSAVYESDNKEIKFYMKNIERDIKLLIDISRWIKNCYLMQNLYILISLFHEIDHAYQKKLRYSNSHNLEVLLLRECNLDYIFDMEALNNPILTTQINFAGIPIEELFLILTRLREKEKFHNKFDRKLNLIDDLYGIKPSERMADISGCLEVINIFNYIIDLDFFRRHETDIEYYLRFDLEIALLRGYNPKNLEYCCPAHEFLIKFESPELWESFDFYDEDLVTLRRNAINQYSFEERLFLGLPIEPEEAKEIYKISRSKFIAPKRTPFKQSTIKEHFIL